MPKFRWSDTRTEGDIVHWTAEHEGRTIAVRISGETIKRITDASGVPPRETLLDRFDDICEEIEDALSRKLVRGEIQPDGSVEISADDWP